MYCAIEVVYGADAAVIVHQVPCARDGFLVYLGISIVERFNQYHALDMVCRLVILGFCLFVDAYYTCHHHCYYQSYAN